MKPLRFAQGISFIELIIVMAIIGILSAIVYPSYTNYVTATRRTDGQTALIELASRLEQFYAKNNSYSNATIGSGNAKTDVAKTDKSPEGWYNVKIKSQSSNNYTIEATPIKNQATADVKCGSLTLNSKGEKGVTGKGSVKKCW